MALPGLWPQLVATIALPAVLDPKGSPRSRINALHNRSVREALRKTLIKHQVERIPVKFESGAAARYNFAERRESTKRIKAQRGYAPQPLRKTGRSARKFRHRRPHAIRMRGKATSGRVEATMVLKWPFPIRRQPTGGIEVKDLSREVEQVDQSDVRGLQRDFGHFYEAEINAGLKPRQRRRLGLGA